MKPEFGADLTSIVLPCFSFFVGSLAPLLLRFFAPFLRCFFDSLLLGWLRLGTALLLVLVVALGAWRLALGAWCLVLAVWRLVLAVWLLELGAWFLVLGSWCLVIGAWCLLDDADQDWCPSRSGALENAPVPDFQFRVPK